MAEKVVKFVLRGSLVPMQELILRREEPVHRYLSGENFKYLDFAVLVGEYKLAAFAGQDTEAKVVATIPVEAERQLGAEAELTMPEDKAHDLTHHQSEGTRTRIFDAQCFITSDLNLATAVAVAGQ